MEKYRADGGALPGPNALFTFSLSSEKLRQAVLSQLMPDKDTADGVILEDGESEVVFYPNQLRVAVRDSFVIFDVQLETDQTGAGHLVIPFRIGSSVDQASLSVTTESVPRGNSTLSARWGTIMQEQLWYALLTSGEAVAKSKPAAANLQLSGLYTHRSNVVFVYSQPATVVDIRNYIDAMRTEGLDPGQEEFAPPMVDLVSPEPERSLCEQVLRELYDLLLQFFRFARKLFQLVVYFVKKLIERLRG